MHYLVRSLAGRTSETEHGFLHAMSASTPLQQRKRKPQVVAIGLWGLPTGRSEMHARGATCRVNSVLCLVRHGRRADAQVFNLPAEFAPARPVHHRRNGEAAGNPNIGSHRAITHAWQLNMDVSITQAEGRWNTAPFVIATQCSATQRQTIAKRPYPHQY